MTYKFKNIITLKLKLKVLWFVIIFTNTNLLLAQDKEKDTLDQQVVNVVKPYQPSVADAFKIKERPKIDDSITTQKKPVKYSIFSIPVASTFTPAKGKAATIEPEQKQRIYNNYACLGAGSYTTILGEFFVNHDLNDSESIGAYINHHSSNGGIDDIVLDNNFSVSQANLYFSQGLRNLNWKIDAGVDLQSYNWYGTRLQLTQNQIDNFDSQQQYSTFYGGGTINFEDGILKKVKAKFTHFNDNFDSSENRFTSAVNFSLPVLADGLNTEVSFDYLDGGFTNRFFANNTLNYGNIILGISPSVNLQQGELNLNLGAQVVYYNDFESNDNKLFFYPQVNASYPLVEDMIETYAGVKGGLFQNSYQQFASENPFVSPTLFITPTDQQYQGFLGFRGKLSNSVNYDINASYGSEKNKALFQSNTINIGITPNTFFAGNSFTIVYDDVKTLNISGALQVNINQNFKLSLVADYFNYETSVNEYAWNLPNITGRLQVEYDISKAWFAGSSLFYTGERKELLSTFGGIISPSFNTEVKTIESFIDANAHVGYRINDQFTAFVKGNNLSGQNYEQWTGFLVQGIQILGGVIYQFDF